MRVSSEERERWVINDVEPITKDAVRELAARHHVRIGEVLDQAVELFCQQLGTSISLPEGWRKPREW